MPTAAPLLIKARDRALRDVQLKQAADLLKQRDTNRGILITPAQI